MFTVWLFWIHYSAVCCWMHYVL